MIEPSDRERAELPECSRQYMADLEGELKRRVHERSAYLTIFHAAAKRWGREEMDHLVSDVDQGIGAHYHRYAALEAERDRLREENMDLRKRFAGLRVGPRPAEGWPYEDRPDEAPAHTAADEWLETQLGQATLERLLRPVRGPQEKSEEPWVCLKRAFRAGYVTGCKAAEGGRA